ncbi:N-acetylglucosaminyltransferase [uncultured Gilvimarinus sp.]|uniref:N-acetylglucosaminyltransferase n=1 Tax=uncultured Gilvimarinus sp. TaxID=1689143 RepID=UPI0030EC320E|tara:strand:- start:3581 stop:4285 length:705 start_codon:yes stop_codon:yes gene_type:complete
MKFLNGSAVLCVLMVLAGCSNMGSKAPAAPEPVVTKPTVSPEQQRARTIARLLSQAERALAQDRLLMPAYDNAYDRYASVLQLDKDNEPAELGMQAIVLRYLDMARDAAQRSRYQEAHTYLDRAATILPDNAAVSAMISEQRKHTLEPQAPVVADNAVMLNAGELQARSDTLKAQLKDLALRARRDDQMVLIVTGSDAEGRWVYQTMREAVKGYLLRGDIKVGSPVRVEFLSPP